MFLALSKSNSDLIYVHLFVSLVELFVYIYTQIVNCIKTVKIADNTSPRRAQIQGHIEFYDINVEQFAQRLLTWQIIRRMEVYRNALDKAKCQFVKGLRASCCTCKL